jgi:transposase InsO family protein
LVLVALSVVEQRLDAVRLVLAGETVTEVAARVGVSRQTLHSWLSRYLAKGVAGLVDRSRRPNACPHRCSGDVEVVVVEMRRKHPRWGAKRIRMQLLKAGGEAVPAERTINRILSRHGLLEHRARKRRRESFKRWQRDAPMQLWQMDIVGGVMIADAATRGLREAKVVTGVDDHSRYCVIAKVVARPTGRAVCLALAEALAKFGVPEEILTDNGKQFTDRFGKGGEVLFDKICRLNGIAHRLTAPASPTTTGKVERFHLTLRRELLDDHELFESLAAAQAALDGFVADYNGERPHQALDVKQPVSPEQRFTPTAQNERALVELWVPPTLAPAVTPGPVADTVGEALRPGEYHGGPIEFDKVVPASGNMWVAHKQFWLGPRRSGLVARFWADCDLIHVSIGGARVKTVRSHLSASDLAKLIASGAVPAGPAPLPGIEDGTAVEVERVVSSAGLISLANKHILVAERLAGIAVGVRIEEQTLMFFDITTRELLRTRANPLTREQALRLRGARPAGPPPRPSTEPIRIQRRASETGVIMVAGQKVALGRTHRGQEVEVLVSETTLAIHLPGQDVRVIRRTTTRPIRNIKADRPRTVPSVS